MKNTTVSVQKCEDYDEQIVLSNVRAHFESLGGAEKFIRSGQNVFIKTNMLMARKPNMVTTTHPSLIKAIAAVAIEVGANVVIGDSSGGVYTAPTLERSYRICGYDEVAKATGATLNFDTGSKKLAFPEGEFCKEFNFINPFHNADVYISACKLKTHAMTTYTGAVKNNFGLIPGLEKPQMHYYFQKPEQFSGMLIDLCLLAKPALTFMDAVIGMEGDGPSGGSPRKIGLTICSENPFALDILASDLVNFKPEEIETVKQAIKRGVSPASVAELEIVGENPEQYKIYDFVRAKSDKITSLGKLPNFLSKPLEKILEPRPKILTEKCIGCGKCAESCPMKAIEIQAEKAVIDKEKCIKCFCCHELCPIRAIEISKIKIFGK